MMNRATFGRLLILVTAIGLSTTANADPITPLVVDGSGESDAAWWVDGPSTTTTPFERALAERRSTVFAKPEDFRTGASLSRIYQRYDLNTTNAANLGRLLGSSYVLSGKLVEQSVRVPLAEGFVSRMVLDADLIDTRTQSTVANLKLVANGSAATVEDARARASRNLVDGMEVRAQALLRNVHDDSQTTAFRVTVLGTGAAAPFVHFRRDVRELLAQRGDVVECAAAEGSVTLCFDIDDAGDEAAFREEVQNMEGQFVEVDVRVARVSSNADGLLVELESGQVQETPDLPFP